MEYKYESYGKCCYCNETVAQNKMVKHLTSHLSSMEKEAKNTKANLTRYFHLKVDCGEMFLQILIKGKSSLDKLDDFLKDIWMECCGHMSAFRDNRIEISMSKKIEAVFIPKIKIRYDYDFGSTTSVNLTMASSYDLDLKENIILLSRNEPLKIMCASCKKTPAIYLCSTCIYEEYAFFCEKCGKKHEKVCHDFEDYSKMDVVNSPRMGVCGYSGGSIDLERDGHYKGE